ncbi:phosphatase PAP2 family protein [Microbacterium mangrovi]|uniref:phosphatase PAP2 family protein n=1 Tax=Microbacterium mangrovi TaxID=1348253 RepID=UPI00068C0CD1|nr:phosphatase PAP2 family protein [Microbacterium mangrovi]
MRRQGGAAISENSTHADPPAPTAEPSVGVARTWIPPTHLGSLIAGVAGILVVVILGRTIHVLGNGPLPIDVWWHDLMRALRTDFGLAVARFMQTVGGTVGVVVTGVVLVAWFALARRPWHVLTVVLAMIVAQLLTDVAKVTFARPRPADSLGATALTSFPSGHTSMAASVAIVLALLLSTRLVWILAVGWIVLMAWSRTYLEAHWLTDVTAGAILGTSVALITWATIDSLRRAAESPALRVPATARDDLDAAPAAEPSSP